MFQYKKYKIKWVITIYAYSNVISDIIYIFVSALKQKKYIFICAHISIYIETVCIQIYYLV